MNIKARALSFYEQHETRVDMAFFLGGFLFDVVTLSQIDDLFSVIQQVLYLLIVGLIISYEFLHSAGKVTLPKWFIKIWEYRGFIIHFMLGSLLSIYSLFFLKSASVFSSITFVGCLMLIMVANEMKSVQGKGIDTKIGLFVICVFSFFSMMIPVLLGFVGWVPFLLALGLTGLALWGWFKLLMKKIDDASVLIRRLILPGASVSGMFFVFYLLGWIPPVPLAVEEMGIYHNIVKRPGVYTLYHENPWWKFWNKGDQDFKARSGDKVHFFAQVFSPARFDDTVVLHWQKYDISQGWQTTDKIPMRVTGGRVGGYRGNATKGNYTPGDWRISVETTDGREIGRLPFSISMDDSQESREFKTEVR
ncbi:MAG: DUF2914 domain-containing protein [Bacteriovoracia bacterium]